MMSVLCCGRPDVESEGVPTRRMSLMERFELMNRNIGLPHIVTYLAKFPTQNGTPPTIESLTERIALLQERFPLLWATIQGRRTPTPFFQPRKQGPWSAKDVIRIESVPTEDGEGLKQSLEKKLLEAELERMALLEADETPPWQITLFQTSSVTKDGNPFSDGEPATPNLAITKYLAVSIDHTHLDGTGGLRLFLLILQPLQSSILKDLPSEGLNTIPQLEETMSTTPTLRHLAPIAYDELILPSLPKWMQKILGRPEVPWPSDHLRAKMRDGIPTSEIGSIDHVLVKALKEKGKKMDVATLHPIFQIAFIVALWSVVTNRPTDSPFNSKSSKKEKDEPFFLVSGITINERKPAEMGHGFCTASYISELEYPTTLLPTSSYWSFAKTLSAFLSSESGRKRGRATIGLLRHIPDGELRGKGEDRPTGWEDYFLDKADSATPARIGIGLSNLGNIPTPSSSFSSSSSAKGMSLPDGSVTDIVWSQSSCPTIPPIMVNMIGFNGGINWTATFGDGSVVSRDEVYRMNRLVEGVLARLVGASGGGVEVSGEVTVEELVKGL